MDTYMDTNEKRVQHRCRTPFISLERAMGIEPATLALGTRFKAMPFIQIFLSSFSPGKFYAQKKLEKKLGDVGENAT